MPTRDWRSLTIRLLQHLMRNQILWAPGGVWSQDVYCIALKFPLRHSRIARSNRSLDALFAHMGSFFIKAWSTSPATPYAGPTVTPDQEEVYGLVDLATGHPSPVPCLAHLTLTTVWGVRPGSGHLGAGADSEGPPTSRYSPG